MRPPLRTLSAANTRPACAVWERALEICNVCLGAISTDLRTSPHSSKRRPAKSV